VNSLWPMEQCRQGKSAKRIRNFGKRIGSEQRNTEEEKSSQILSLARSVASPLRARESPTRVPPSLSPAAAPIPNRDSLDGGHRRRQQDPQRQAGEEPTPSSPRIRFVHVPFLSASSLDFGQRTLVSPEDRSRPSAAAPNGMEPWAGSSLSGFLGRFLRGGGWTLQRSFKDCIFSPFFFRWLGFVTATLSSADADTRFLPLLCSIVSPGSSWGRGRRQVQPGPPVREGPVRRVPGIDHRRSFLLTDFGGQRRDGEV